MIENNLVRLAEVREELIQCFQLLENRHVALFHVHDGLDLAFERRRSVQVRLVAPLEILGFHNLKVVNLLDVLLRFVSPLLDVGHV